MPTSETARADRFAAYVDRLATTLGHRDRDEPLRAYVTGLCLPGDRKSIEPMAARLDPRHVRRRHQSMHHFVADAPWDAAAVLQVAREWVLESMVRHGPVAAWIVDDTAFPKKGQHSVGVARQYCGVLGKQENCQVAVSVSVANDTASLPVAYQLYLPESWARDRRRRRAVGVPDPVAFQPKWQIALGQIRGLQAEALPAAPVVADAGYGDTTEFRDALTTAAIPYAVGVKGDTTVWRPGATRAPAPALGRARPAADARAPHRDPSPGQAQDARDRTAARGVAAGDMAREAPAGPCGRALRACGCDPPIGTRIDRPPARTSGCSSSGRPGHPNRRNIGSRPCPRRPRSRRSSASRSCGGGSNATIRNSKTNWAWTTSRGAAGVAFIIMAPYASRRMPSSPPSARGFPPAPLAFLRPAPLPKGFKPRGAPGAA